jgi:glycerol-3-phosphate responsive antiterminator
VESSRLFSNTKSWTEIKKKIKLLKNRNRREYLKVLVTGIDNSKKRAKIILEMEDIWQ